MTNQDQILLQTKLHRPRLPHNLVVRTRLLEALNHAIDHQLTLVCAPAGFGKTTLVCSWLEQMPADQPAEVAAIPAAWLSLDADDSNLNLFIRYFIAALRTIFKEACEKTLALLLAQGQPPDTMLYATLSNELAELPGEAILVLDDYHTVRGTEVHNLLIELVRHWPSPLHLVLITRIDPPIPLTGLRAKGNFSEIRTQNLRFTPEETVAFLGLKKLNLYSEIDLLLLEERFEGWPAGLHLAALSLGSASSQESIQSALSRKNANITGYLVDEVLNHQAPAIHSFLLKTSILDRFCAALCEAVIGEIDAAWNARACLDWIERSELFLISLDDRQEWYRYHHLFQESLQQRLSAEMAPDQASELHCRASTWLEEQGLLDEALHHAVAAGDVDLAARQMSAGLCDVLNRGDRPTLERWLYLLPQDAIQRHPELLMIRAWVLQFLWRLDQQAKLVREMEELLDSGRGASLPENDLQILRGQIVALKGQAAYFNNQTARAIELCRETLALLPPSWTYVRGGMNIYLGLSMLASGQAPTAERLLLDEYESYSDKTDTYGLYLLVTLGFIYLHTGRLDQTRQIAQVVLQGATRRRLPILQSWAYHFLGSVCYHRNELEAAAQYFTQTFENRYTSQTAAFRDAVAGLALIHQVIGESSEAWQIVESTSQIDLELGGREDERTRSLRARLMLMRGDLEGAHRWVDTFIDPPPDRALIWLEEQQVTRARILMSSVTDSDRCLALQILDALNEIADRTHNVRYKIEILVLRALALDAQGETSQADVALKQAVDLARSGSFIRVFVELGSPMQAMLCRLSKQDDLAETISRILAAFLTEYSSPEDDKNLAASAPHPPRGNSTLVEPLTPRELEVLTLLRGPLSIKEIAHKLHVSYQTVRRHIANIYGKLGVNGRWDAVAIAEELNLIPPR